MTARDSVSTITSGPTTSARWSGVRSFLSRPILPAESLRAQLLGSLGVLLAVALLALVCVLLVWISQEPSPGLLVTGIFLFLIAEIAVVMLFGDYVLRRRFVRPLERMVAGAEAVAAGDYDRRLEPEGAGELVRLSESVNGMADRLVHHQRLLAENVESLNETNRLLTETRNELIHSEKLASVGRLAAGIAHEVGNPLGSILGYLEVARRRGAAGEAWLDEVEREVKRVDGVVRGLLDFARPRQSAGRTFALEESVREALALVRTQGRLKDVRVREVLEAGPSEVVGDPSHVEQVVVNLLLNAVDAIAAAPEGEAEGVIEIRTRREVFEGPDLGVPPRRATDPDDIDYSHLRRWHRGPGYRTPSFEAGQALVCLEVVDDGAGLEREELDKVFEPFYTTKEPGRGTGLGLAVSARVVEEMGGSIAADLTPGGRTCFRVLLPAAGEREARAEGPA